MRKMLVVGACLALFGCVEGTEPTTRPSQNCNPQVVTYVEWRSGAGGGWLTHPETKIICAYSSREIPDLPVKVDK